MLTVSKSHLKAHMLEIFRKAEYENEELIVTDHNRPVLRVIPIRAKNSPEDVFAEFRGRVRYHEDLTSATVDEWDIS